jgi:C_GCAxxG_C_C family probable redox protein
MTREEKAKEFFSKGYSCSQAVFAALGHGLGMDLDLAFRIAAPFRAGMGRTGRTCGAVTGAYMALGLKHGDGDPADNAAKDRVCALVQEFDRQFVARHGSTGCSELVGCDMGKPEERVKAAEKGIFFTLCPRLVADAVEIAGALIGPEDPR